MDNDSQTRAIDSLREWSKWLIGIGFSAATGCVVVLQGEVPPLAQLALVLAITAFTLGVLCSALLLRVLASMVEQLPLTDPEGARRSIYAYRSWLGITVGHIAAAQLVFLTLGGLFFLAWIIAPLVPGPTAGP